MNPDNGAAFVEANKDFVLKLNFAGDGDVSQVRRIRLPRILDGSGNVSYEELCGLAISFVIPENVSKDDSSQIGIRLTYKDEDDDLITIGSTPELLDAMDQFADQKVLRVTAEIKRRKANTSAAVPVVAAIRPPSPGASTTASTADMANQAGRPKHAVLQQVVESIVNVVLNAAVAVNGSSGSPSGTVFYTPDGMPAATIPMDSTTGSEEEKPKAVDVAKKPVEEEAKLDVNAKKKEEPTTTKEDAKPKAKSVPVVAATKPTAAPEEPVKEDRPFIHGRHTCDSCLGTPIIGLRYHAKNLPDYDLCQNCFGKYQGTDIEFEPVELDRDHNFQERWRRRQERMKNKSGRENRRRWGPRHRGCRPPGPPCPPPHHHGHHPHPPPGPPCPPPHHHGHHPPPPPGPCPPPPPGPCHHGHHPPPPPHHHHHHGPPPPPPKAAYDVALEEAIRQSLRDLNKQEGPTDAAVKPAPEPSAPLEEDIKAQVPTEEVEGVVSKAEETLEEEDKKPEAVPVEEVLVTVSEVKEEKAAPEELADSTSKKSECETSFASDAVGSGEIADMLGETLDKCAEAINDLQAELDRSTYSSVCAADSVSVDGDEHVEDEIVVEPVVVETVESEDDVVTDTAPVVEEAEVTDGATILESVDRNDEARSDEPSEDDGWQVVSEEQQQLTNDEELARAAQMVGSALFTSDMDRSGEALSVLLGAASGSAEVPSESSGSDSFSFASSVPTTLPSLSGASARGNVTADQRARWSIQLEALHEMGFDNDAKIVEILERLTAANIGSDNDEEISVSRVVNELWKN